MPFPSETYLNMMRTMGNLTPQEFEALYAQLEGFLGVEHKDDGSHAALTADSIVVAGDATVGGDAVVTGDITARPNTAFETQIGAVGSGSGIKMTGQDAQYWRAHVIPTSTTRYQWALEDENDGGNKAFLGAFYYALASAYVLGPVENSPTHSLDLGRNTGSSSDRIRNIWAQQVFANLGFLERGRTVYMGDYDTYVPAWTSDGTAPDIGNSTVTGRYTRVGDKITGSLSIAFGNTATFGTGSYRFSLPVASNAVANSVTEIGGCLIRDAGTAFYVGRARQLTTTTVEVILSDGGGTVGATTPFTFVATDQIGIDFCYEAA